MAQQVTCINRNTRTNPHERITHIGWPGNKISAEQAIRNIESGIQSYFVRVAGHEVKIIVVERQGVKYLKTQNDGDSPDNLLSLPDCP
jgi:hypothetical protein